MSPLTNGQRRHTDCPNCGSENARGDQCENCGNLLDALDLPERAGLGCLAQPSGRIMRLWAALASEDGKRVVRADLTGPLDEPEQQRRIDALLGLLGY